MTILRNALARWRDRRRLASARKAIRQAERQIARRRRVVGPGYDELLRPGFIALMIAAAAVIMVL